MTNYLFSTELDLRAEFELRIDTLNHEQGHGHGHDHGDEHGHEHGHTDMLGLMHLHTQALRLTDAHAHSHANMHPHTHTHTYEAFTANEKLEGGAEGSSAFSDTDFATPLEILMAESGPTANSIPGDISTTATIAIGQQIVENLEISGDQDWFQVNLVAGTTYNISSLGIGSTPLSDPLVRVMDANGTELAQNDDIQFGDIRNSLLTYTATTSGTFYISAQAFSTQTGTYALTLTEGNENNGDLSADVNTTGTAVVNGSVEGTFDTASDVDWYQIDLVAGQRYLISIDDTSGDRNGNGPGDTFLRFYDASGNLLETDDDSGVNDNAKISFVATTSGSYFIGADSLNTTGTYGVTVQEVPNLEERDVDGIAHFLTDEFDTRESYGSNTITYNISGLSAGAQALALRALDAWADVAPLTFVQSTAGGADIVFQNTGDGASNSNVTIGGVIQSSSLNVATDWNGGNLSVDSYTYQTFLHEIGHSLGLGHAGRYNGDATYNVDNAYLNDSWAYTVMSYFDQNESGYFGDLRFVLGPQIADIIAIQDLYGANTTTRGGDNVYGFNSTETDVHDFSQFTRAPSLSIFDTGGTDTLDFSGYAQEQRIDLNDEAFSDINGLDGVISIARGVVIENAIGGSGVDTITGNAASNELTGGAGNDILDGGAGTDYAIYNLASASDYTIVDNMDGSFTVTANSGNEGADTLWNIEFLKINGVDVALGDAPSGPTFTENRDVYTGDATDQVLNALGGNDAIRGGGGDDTIDGGAGNDNLFGDAGADTLIGGIGNDKLTGGSEVDTIFGGDGIDLIFGQGGNDILDGGANVDKFFGGDGDDTIMGGGGNDAVFGDDGDDTIHGDGGNDRLRGRNDNDTIYGGEGDDNLKGGNGLDFLQGDAGNDVMFGQSGDDTLIGGAGNDQLFGGSGNDIFRFALSDGGGSDRVNDFNVGDTVELNGFGFADAVAASGSFVQFGANVKFTEGGLTIIFVDALVADVRAAVAVDGNAELPALAKDSATIAEDVFANADLKQDTIADFLADQVQFDLSEFTDHDGLRTIDVDGMDWSDVGL